MVVSKVLYRSAVIVRDAGIMGYEDALRLQMDLVEKRISGKDSDTLVMLEHDPVVTLGRKAEESSLFDPDFFIEKNIPVIRTGRGGQNTYHSPGQLVMYPIVKLEEEKRDISLYIDFLEKVITKGLNRLGVPAGRKEAHRGVWGENKKIAFLGIAVRKWVTFHGAAININNELAPFRHMHPCGEEGIAVTSAKECKGVELDIAKVKEVFAEEFKKGFIGEWK